LASRPAKPAFGLERMAQRQPDKERLRR